MDLNSCTIRIFKPGWRGTTHSTLPIRLKNINSTTKIKYYENREPKSSMPYRYLYYSGSDNIFGDELGLEGWDLGKPPNRTENEGMILCIHRYRGCHEMGDVSLIRRHKIGNYLPNHSSSGWEDILPEWNSLNGRISEYHVLLNGLLVQVRLLPFNSSVRLYRVLLTKIFALNHTAQKRVWKILIWNRCKISSSL